VGSFSLPFCLTPFWLWCVCSPGGIHRSVVLSAELMGWTEGWPHLPSPVTSPTRGPDTLNSVILDCKALTSSNYWNINPNADGTCGFPSWATWGPGEGPTLGSCSRQALHLSSLYSPTLELPAPPPLPSPSPANLPPLPPALRHAHPPPPPRPVSSPALPSPLLLRSPPAPGMSSTLTLLAGSCAAFSGLIGASPLCPCSMASLRVPTLPNKGSRGLAVSPA